MKLSEIMRATTGFTAMCDMEADITDICYDSRKAKPGCAFVAIRGLVQDGNDFIASALDKGASVIVTDALPAEGVAFPYIIVPDSRAALADMSAQFFGNPQSDIKIIGVTGTKGKTTVSTLIYEIITYSGKKCGLIGTNGVTIPGAKHVSADRTTPESYGLMKLLAQMRDKGCEYAVMEVSSHSLCLERVRGLEFECAVFTNLSQDHLDYHQTMENYFEAKSRLFDMCKAAIINMDDPAGKQLIENKQCPQITYSAREDAADLVAKNIKLKGGGVEFEAVMRGGIERISLAVPGMFSVYNALAATGAAAALGLGLDCAGSALPKVAGIAGRAEVVPVPEDYSVIIDYAHSPDSVENILTALRGFAKERIICLFGCGGDRDRTKRPVMGEIASRLSDECIITSDNPRSEDPWAIIDDIIPGARRHATPLHIIEDRRQAIALALTIAQPGDVIVLMGKGHETYQEINGKKHHLDEREVVADYFCSGAPR